LKRLLYFASILCAIVLSIALLAGCATSEKPPATSTPSPPQTEESSQATTPSPATEPETTQSSGETLDDILGLASSIESVKFDMVVTSTEISSMTTTVWLKEQKMKMKTASEGQTIITILDQEAQTMYTYMPDQNMAFMMTYDQAQASPIDDTQNINQYNPQNVGTETIDGKVCMVVEYTVQDVSVTTWIWKEYGFPIKVVSVTAQGTTTIEYKNIDFTNIPDSEFQLPAGVQIMDFSSLCQSMSREDRPQGSKCRLKGLPGQFPVVETQPQEQKNPRHSNDTGRKSRPLAKEGNGNGTSQTGILCGGGDNPADGSRPVDVHPTSSKVNDISQAEGNNNRNNNNLEQDIMVGEEDLTVHPDDGENDNKVAPGHRRIPPSGDTLGQTLREQQTRYR